MAGRILDYALHCPLSPRVSKVIYLGDAAGAAWLDRIGVSYQRSATLDAGAGLVLIGPDAAVDCRALNTYLEKGGKAFFLPRSQADGWPWRHAEAGRSSISPDRCPCRIGPKPGA